MLSATEILSEADLGLIKLVVMMNVSFSITINTKLKLKGSFTLNRKSLITLATAEINVSVHSIC